jgi:RHS repeat-associated protein
VTDTYRYGGFGHSIVTNGITSNVLRWIGSLYYCLDEDAGSISSRHRIYEPTTSRWHSIDIIPIALFVDLLSLRSGIDYGLRDLVDQFTTSLFRYAANAPFTWVDPNGTSKKKSPVVPSDWEKKRFKNYHDLIEQLKAEILRLSESGENPKKLEDLKATLKVVSRNPTHGRLIGRTGFSIGRLTSAGCGAAIIVLTVASHGFCKCQHC